MPAMVDRLEGAANAIADGLGAAANGLGAVADGLGRAAGAVANGVVIVADAIANGVLGAANRVMRGGAQVGEFTWANEEVFPLTGATAAAAPAPTGVQQAEQHPAVRRQNRRVFSYPSTTQGDLAFNVAFNVSNRILAFFNQLTNKVIGVLLAYAAIAELGAWARARAVCS
jgi:hypothetical protein